MTISDDVRAAADVLRNSSDSGSLGMELATRLRAHAALLERIEREMRDPENVPFGGMPQLDEWADALAGETT